jgi:probable HAF family extracellular repeat protein
VNVTPTALSNTINFDVFDASAGVGGSTLDHYLAGFGITLTSTGAPVLISDDRAIYGGGIVQATTGHNVLGQGSGNPVGYTLTFTNALSSFAFDSVTENSGPSGSSYPIWSATAYDSSGHVIATVGEPEQIIWPGSSDPATHYVLSGSNIASVTFNGDDHNFDGFSTVLTDTWVLTPQIAAATVSNFTTIDYPGEPFAVATDINNSGQIVGYADFGSFAPGQIGWELSGGNYSSINPGAHDTAALAINDLGVVSGFFEPSSPTPRFGFTEIGGTFTQTINLSPFASTTADGINDAGVIVGSSYLGGNSYSSFIDAGGVITSLNVPGASFSTRAAGINNANDVVGFYDNLHGFLDHGGVFTTIDDPLATNGTFASKINNAGQIVGWYDDSSNKPHGFLDTNGVFTTIDNPLGVNGTTVNGINDAGQIVGSYTDASHVIHAFVATLNNPVGASTNDVLVANPQGSTLFGGAGNDTFVFNTAPQVQSSIADFIHGSDVLQISAAGFGHGLTTGATPTLATGAPANVSNPGTNGAFIFDNTDPTGGTLYWDSNGGSGADATPVVKLQGVTSLLPSDFHVV